MRVRQGEDYVLFCLDGVGRSHVVAGDVAALARRQGTSEPPVAFSVTQRQTDRQTDRKRGTVSSQIKLDKGEKKKCFIIIS